MKNFLIPDYNQLILFALCVNCLKNWYRLLLASAVNEQLLSAINAVEELTNLYKKKSALRANH